MTTSRVARKPIIIPSGVEVKVQGRVLSAKGSKGTLNLDIHPFVTVNIDDKKITIGQNHDQSGRITGTAKKLFRSIAGTMRASINNMIQGVSAGFEVKLQAVGVGYRAQVKGKSLALSLGYSHPTEYHLLEGVTAETPSQTEIVLKSPSKEKVGQAAAEIREYRAPEPYKGKGIRYAGEVIQIKETKKK